MDAFEEIRFIERQQFFDGQRLFADDLQELEAFHRRMRWLHNQSLHQPGVGNGLAIRGNEGDRQVAVGPGYAIDALGREIVLIEEKSLQVPPVAGDRNGRPVYFDLTVSYPDDADLEVAETRAGICADRGTVRLREEPVFCWVRLRQTETGQKVDAEKMIAEDGRLAADVEQGLKLVVGRVAVLNCQLYKTVSLEQRRSARPPAACHITCDTYKPDPWQVAWFVEREQILDALVTYISDHESLTALGVVAALLSTVSTAAFTSASAQGFPMVLPFALQAEVPTAAAGVLTQPCYTVRVDGSRLGLLAPPPPDEPIPS